MKQDSQIAWCNNCVHVSYDSNVTGVIGIYFCTLNKFNVFPLPLYSMACTKYEPKN